VSGPKVKFCWECGNKLVAGHHKMVSLPHQTDKVTMHKGCAMRYHQNKVIDFPTISELRYKETENNAKLRKESIDRLIKYAESLGW
jgi:hypothetical protein